MNDIVIKEASPEDYSEIKELMLSALKNDPFAFSTEHSEYVNNSEMWWNNYLFPYLYKSNAKLFIAKQVKNPIGIIGIIYDSKERRKHVASLVWVYVESLYRGKGIASMLIDYALLDIKSKKTIKKVSLLVNNTQTNAINLYRKYGFVEVGQLKNELLIKDKYINEYIMELYI